MFICGAFPFPQERKAARKAIEQKEGKLAALNAVLKPGEWKSCYYV